MSANIFSHPAFVPTGAWRTVGYNLTKSAATGNKPNFFGPWNDVSAYQNYTGNTDIVDIGGTYWDMYRVAPLVEVTLPNGSLQTVALPPSRPFFAWQSLYDIQISALIDTFRNDHLLDQPVKRTDSTIPSENSGSGVLPFMTDSNTSRFFLSFLPGSDPIRIITETVQVYQGASQSGASIITPYADYYPSDDGGYIDFATNPPAGNYLKVEYEAVRYTNDQIRASLLNAVSALSLYGINNYGVTVSNNLLQLSTPLPNRDLGEIICLIAEKKMLSAQTVKSFEQAEAWKSKDMEFTADPSRSIQAATMHVNNIEESLRHKCNAYIYNTRNYISRGEFESFFDVSGVLPVYAMIVAGTNLGGAMGYWL